MVSFELGKEVDKEKRGTKKKVCVPTRNRTSDLRIPLYDALPLSPRESTAGEIYYEVHMTHGDSEFFFLCHAHDKTKNIFIYFFAELKIYHLSYCINKYDTIDIADPSSMQDACHMNFVIDLAHHSLEHRSAASEGPRFDSSWGLRIFFLVPRSWEDEKHLYPFLYRVKQLITESVCFPFL